MFKNIVLSLLLVVISSVVYAAPKGSGPEIGQTVPKLYGRALNDDLYSLKKDIGRVKVINFFWVECHPCRKELPELAKLEQKYQDIKFISVHTSLHKKTEEPETVVKFIQSLKAAPSNIVLTTGKNLGEIFNIIGLPHTMVLDKDNTVLMNISGYDKKSMKKLLATLQRITKK